MEPMFSIKEILEAVNDIQNKKKDKKSNIKEVTISGYEVADTKLVKLDNGSYRSFILLEYPIAQVYKAFINRVEENENLKSSVKALKNTEAFKELEQYVAEFSGA